MDQSGTDVIPRHFLEPNNTSLAGRQELKFERETKKREEEEEVYYWYEEAKVGRYTDSRRMHRRTRRRWQKMR